MALLNADQAEGDDEDFPEGLEGLQGALEGGGGAPPGVHYLNVTTEENAAIERVSFLECVTCMWSNLVVCFSSKHWDFLSRWLSKRSLRAIKTKKWPRICFCQTWMS